MSDVADINMSDVQAPQAEVGHADDMETTLRQAQELIGLAMSSRNRSDRQIRHLPGDDTAFHSAIGDMISRAQREVLCVFSAQDMSADRHNPTLPLLMAAHQRGVQVKALVPSPVTAFTPTLRAMGSQPGYRIRELPDQNLVIADGREAVLRTPRRENEQAQTLHVSVHPLVQALRTMFGVSWSSGIPLAEIFQVHENLTREPARSILASLSAGDKDEVAARKLGISVRTYRRHVADVMRDMRATSRFQAGARAAKLGIIFNTA
jgi:DNA-binding CsgD family transcriptional regulator